MLANLNSQQIYMNIYNTEIKKKNSIVDKIINTACSS